ncbi:MAG: GMC family oxidoreductase [Acidobacteria bacterium]|nr:GMC family oxidoreductase [Acidobacteriota bacterium]
MKYDYDVIIVGSGVAGAMCAWKLSTLGDYRILILEAGDNGIGQGQRVEFHHAMDRQGNRGDMFAPYLELESRKMVPSPEKAGKPLDAQKAEEKYYDYTPESQDSFRAGYTRLVGGSTWAWRGNCPRFLPSDFALRSTYGAGRDWPISYGELEKSYCEAEQELGVSGNHDELDGLFGAFRSRPFPMPGIPLTYSDQLVKTRIHGKTVNGTKVRVITTPQARNSEPYDGRPACEGHSNCIPLCPIQAKYDATVHLRRVLVKPNVTLRSGAAVTRVSAGRDGNITRVHFRDWRSDDKTKDRVLTAPVIVLAAHAIETPKILLMSNVANSSGQVGRNLMDHIQWEIAAEFPEPVYPFRGPQSVTAIEAFRDGPFRRTRSGFRMTIGNDGWGRAGSPAKIIDELLTKDRAYGPDLMTKVADRVTRMIRLSFSTEMLPHPENRVDLSANTDAALGIPRPRFTFAVDDYATEALKAGVETATALFNLMGAKIEKKDLIENGKLNWNTAAHIMGTCIMGNNPADSVVDKWGRTHDNHNLYIAGSSVFATGATANPTLTLVALTLRTARAIHKQLKAGGVHAH